MSQTSKIHLQSYSAMAVAQSWKEKNITLLKSYYAMALVQSWKEKNITLFIGFKRWIATSTVETSEIYAYGNNDIRTLCKQGRFKEALHILQHENHYVDCATYTTLLNVCINNKMLSEAKLIHAHMTEMGIQSDIMLGNILINMYAKCGRLMESRRVLDQMPKQNVVSWTVVISAYVRHGKTPEALELYHEMIKKGIQPNQFTFASVLPAFAKLGILQKGKEVHEDIMKSGFQSDIFVGSALVDMYIKCGSMEDARQMFDKISERNVISWTAMITGYIQNGHIDEATKLFNRMPERDVVSWTTLVTGYSRIGRFNEALELFGQMRLTGVSINPDTFACILPACANLASLEHGKKIHNDIIKTGFETNLFVGNALVDMYGKCGSIEDALNMFDKMPRRDVVSWTAMIFGYAMHGYGREALQFFEQMQSSGTKPDHVTFVALLSACCHAGLLDDGLHCFNSMRIKYHITPVMEHYCCVVDLLGRAGRLDEAQHFINKMPIKPNSAVWGSLLGACRMYNNVDLGVCVAEHLFELDPESPGPYVVLSNIYAAAGKWDGIEKVRQMMKDRKVKNKPGCSWIEVNKQVHSFLVGDRSHPQTETIYAELDRLSGQIKEAGYVQDTRFVLNAVEEEQKQQFLCHHSEKLAIAYGLINTPSGTTIRVIKNLRMCGNCHSATKFIAKIVERHIIVRDANRFHHFSNGQCSCGDYW